MRNRKDIVMRLICWINIVFSGSQLLFFALVSIGRIVSLASDKTGADPHPWIDITSAIYLAACILVFVSSIRWLRRQGSLWIYAAALIVMIIQNGVSLHFCLQSVGDHVVRFCAIDAGIVLWLLLSLGVVTAVEYKGRKKLG